MGEKASPSKGRMARAIGGVGRIVKAVPLVRRAAKKPRDPAADAVRRAAKRAKLDKKGAFLLREDERPDANAKDKPARPS